MQSRGSARNRTAFCAVTRSWRTAACAIPWCSRSSHRNGRLSSATCGTSSLQEHSGGAIMLIDFFFTLKDAKIPVSIKEFMILLEAMKKSVISPSLDEFYFLSRMTLVKDESHYDKF